MTNEEMKIVRFRTIIKDLWGDFGEFKRVALSKNPLSILWGENSDNPFVKVILKETFKEGKAEPFECQDEACSSLNNIEDLIKECQACSDCSFYNCSLSGQMIFFSLLLAALDEKRYQETVELIADFAFLIGFDKDMMKDWIYAVKSILQNEELEIRKMKTEQAKNFFEILV
ncbi:hypothetical protein [Blautia producta]|uniref:hypothetical protein n=1 Tax=Blautia producta TaxID=33035 RepID=UPI0031B5BE70